MARNTPMQFGVITLGGDYAINPVLGTKNDGEYIIFPPLNVANQDVIAYFDSETEAKLWVTTKRLENALLALKAEQEAHKTTKERARALLSLVGTFKDIL